MLTSIKDFFNTHLKTTAENIESAVDAIQLASAALLIELSKADQTIDEVETQTLLTILQQKFNLPEDSLSELLSLAQQEAEESTSLYQFTSLINEAYTYPEKQALMTNMWEVAYADGDLDRYEDNLIRKVAELIYITHSDFIRTKLSVKNAYFKNA